MNENDKPQLPQAPDRAAGEVHAEHGYRNEVTWDGGAGRQPYANQGDEEQGPDTAAEVEGGDAGEAAGRNIEQLDEVKRKPEPPVRESPRKA